MNLVILALRQTISATVERLGYAECLKCGRPTVKMFFPSDLGLFYVRCQSCLMFYPQLSPERHG